MSPKKTTAQTIRSSISVSSLKEKTRQGLKRLTSKGALKTKPPCTAALAVKSASPAVKKNSRTRSDENTPARSKVDRTKTKCVKERQNNANSRVESEFPARVRMAKRRVPVSMASALQEVKGNFTKAVENVSTKLKMSRRRSVRKTLYDPLVDADTPVKMYSPFGIETPDTAKSQRATRAGRRSAGSTPVFKKHSQNTRSSARNNLHDKNDARVFQEFGHFRNLLDTPTGKFRQDLEDVTRGVEELHSLTRRLRDRAQQEQIWS